MSGEDDKPNTPDTPAMAFDAPATPVAIAIGVDLIARARLLQTYAHFGERFLRRVFTETELAQGQYQIERLIGRFAAKEACSKALGTGMITVAWREIEIIRTSGGKPAIRLHGRAAARAQVLGLTAFDVSISDTHDHAMAVVVALRA